MCDGASMQLKKVFKADDANLGMLWDSGENTQIPFADLRFECACAECVDEWTRQRKMTRERVASDIRPLSIEPVGRYAIQISWSDGHKTGIYTFESLYELSKGKLK